MSSVDSKGLHVRVREWLDGRRNAAPTAGGVHVGKDVVTSVRATKFSTPVMRLDASSCGENGKNGDLWCLRPRACRGCTRRQGGCRRRCGWAKTS